MPRKKENLRADGRAEICRVVNGKTRHFYGASKREAEEKYKAALAHAADVKEHGALFEDVAADWWQDHEKNIKKGATRAYVGSYKAALDAFSGYGMKEITPGMIKNWGLKFQAQGKAASTLQNARSVLSCIYKFWCVRDDEIYNPVSVVDMPQNMKREEREPPEPEQVQIVLEHPEGFGLCAWIFMFTGCRLGEVLALQWKDVDFEKGTIHITKSVSWIHNQPVIGEPKTKNALRTVPLLQPLRTILEPQIGKAEEYILGKEKPLTSQAYQRRWEYYCRDVGMAEIIQKTRKQNGKIVNYKRYKPLVTAHQFRHEYATMLYNAKVDVLEAKAIMGHSDITTTRRIYTHIKKRQMQDAVEKLNNYIVNNSSYSKKST